ncbi:hypothetical protein ABZ352_35520 [Streptomyces griseofuscus]|uniref:hypothetical protein n=1 Tax=Streptomyces griseofuscus TaxID=146922 RepID=UPI0033C1F93E
MTYTLSDAIRDQFERDHPNGKNTLLCLWCRRRKDRLDFRETPWHGRAAACEQCERLTYWELEGERSRWQLDQARETARGLRRGLRLIRVAQLRAFPQRYMTGMEEKWQ